MGDSGDKVTPIAWCKHVDAKPLVLPGGGTAIQLALFTEGKLYEKMEHGEVMILCRACFFGAMN